MRGQEVIILRHGERFDWPALKRQMREGLL